MFTIKKKVETSFGKLASLEYKHPWWFILSSLVFVSALCWQLQYIKIDTTTEGFLKPNDPALILFNNFRHEFGRDEQFLIAIETEEVFTEQFLTNLVAMHKEFELEVPYVDEVTSLWNVRNIYSEDDELYVEDLLEEMPETEQDYEQLAEYALSKPLLRDSYFSRDRKLASIYIRPNVYYAELDKKTGEKNYKLLGEEQIHEMYVAIENIISHYPAINQSVHIGGTPALTEELNIYLVGDMLTFIVIALVVIALVLYLLFKRILSVVLPLLTMVMALLSTMSLMSITGQPVQMPTVILPSFILAVGVGDSIHLLTIFFRHVEYGEEKEEALENALAHTGLPMFFTSVTTAASLFSFGQSEILPIANLGIFAAVGVMFAFVYTIVLLPALISLTPVRPVLKKQDENENPLHYKWLESFLSFSVSFAQNQSGKIIIVSAVIMVFFTWSASQLSFSHDPVKWLPDDSPGKQAVDIIGEKVGGSVPIEIIIDSGDFDGVKDVEFLTLIDKLQTDLSQLETDYLEVGKVIAITDILKETNMALFNNDPEAYKVPDNNPLIAQELLMLETSGAEDLFKMVDKNYQKARMTILLPWVDALYFGEFVKDVKATISSHFKGLAEVKVTGIVPMLAQTLRQIMEATAMSYVIAFIVISMMMVLLLGSFKYGLLSMLPNLLPITMALGLMNITGAPLDMFSMLIGSIAIGLSVDDTVHFMHGFRRVYEQTNDAYLAVEETLQSSGRAMLSTSIVLTLGFLTYLFSVMNNLQDFGIYTALCIVVALLADFWMAPALVLWVNRKHSQPQV